jgi:hypothetical protein
MVKKKSPPRKVVVQVEGVEDIDTVLLEDKINEGIHETLGDEVEIDVEIVEMPEEEPDPDRSRTIVRVAVTSHIRKPANVSFAPVDEDGDEGNWIVHALTLQEAEFLLEELTDVIRRIKEREARQTKQDG